MNQAESFKKRTQQIANTIQKMLAEECEACARQAESVGVVLGEQAAAQAIAASIRDRNSYR